MANAIMLGNIGGSTSMHSYEAEITFDSDTQNNTISYDIGDRNPYLVGVYALDEIGYPSSGYYLIRGYVTYSWWQDVAQNKPPLQSNCALTTSDARISNAAWGDFELDTQNKTIKFRGMGSVKFQAGKRYRFIIM